jgi:hypothetical protein
MLPINIHVTDIGWKHVYLVDLLHADLVLPEAIGVALWPQNLRTAAAAVGVNRCFDVA